MESQTVASDVGAYFTERKFPTLYNVHNGLISWAKLCHTKRGHISERCLLGN